MLRGHLKLLAFSLVFTGFYGRFQWVVNLCSGRRCVSPCPILVFFPWATIERILHYKESEACEENIAARVTSPLEDSFLPLNQYFLEFLDHGLSDALSRIEGEMTERAKVEGSRRLEKDGNWIPVKMVVVDLAPLEKPGQRFFRVNRPWDFSWARMPELTQYISTAHTITLYRIVL